MAEELNMELQRHEPDWLDRKCTEITEVLGGLSLEERRGVLEQMLDYLRMEEAEDV